MSKLKRIVDAVADVVDGDAVDGGAVDGGAVDGGAPDAFHVDPGDFLSAREGQQSTGTRMTQEVTGMEGASEVLNRSTAAADESGEVANVISPV